MPATTFIDESLMQLLSVSADIAASVGSRIYAVQAPQGTTLLVTVKDENDQQEPANPGDQTPIYRTDLTVEITHSES